MKVFELLLNKCIENIYYRSLEGRKNYWNRIGRDVFMAEFEICLLFGLVEGKKGYFLKVS